MLVPVQNGIITSEFYDPRPISNPGAHIHGAIDITYEDTKMVYSPVKGIATMFMVHRPKDWVWPKFEKEEITEIPIHDYWYDVYGGVVAIEEPNGRYHILTHFYGKTLFEKYGIDKYIESIEISRWCGIILQSKSFRVSRGDELVKMGNAGFSSGLHVHWEIHPTNKLVTYSKRINPHEYLA